MFGFPHPSPNKCMGHFSMSLLGVRSSRQRHFPFLPGSFRPTLLVRPSLCSAIMALPPNLQPQEVTHSHLINQVYVEVRCERKCRRSGTAETSERERFRDILESVSCFRTLDRHDTILIRSGLGSAAHVVPLSAWRHPSGSATGQSTIRSTLDGLEASGVSLPPSLPRRPEWH